MLCIDLVTLVTEEQGDTIDSTQRYNDINDILNHCITRSNPRNDVKGKQRDATPVESTDNQDGKGNFVENVHKESSYFRVFPE